MKRSNHFVRIFPYISVNYLFYPFNYLCIKGVFDSGRLKFQNNAFISNSVNSSAPGIWEEIGLVITHTQKQLLALMNSTEFKFSLEKGSESSVNINSYYHRYFFF